MATWFERDSRFPIAFTHELWRMVIKVGVREEDAKALLVMVNSKVTAYLINLFSTNNHIVKDDLGRVPTPDPQTLPVTQLAALANELMEVRAGLERDFVVKYKAKLPEFDDGEVYVPPSAVLAAARLPKLRMMDLVGRGEVRNHGAVNGRIRALRARNLIVCTADPANPHTVAFARILDLFLREPEREHDSWGQAQQWQLPELVAAEACLALYTKVSQEAQMSWERFVALQRRVDEVVADWYGFDADMRAAIAEGLPWARRRRNGYR